MNQMENNSSFKLDIQPNGVKMNDYLEKKIQNLVKKLRQALPEINWIDIYLKTTEEPQRPRTVVVRMGLPGPDIVASDAGLQWKILLKNLEKRLVRQLEKRKALLGKPVFFAEAGNVNVTS